MASAWRGRWPNAGPRRDYLHHAFDQFAVAAFEVEAVDYLMKPVEPSRLQRALGRGRDYLERREADRTSGPSLSLIFRNFGRRI